MSTKQIVQIGTPIIRACAINVRDFRSAEVRRTIKDLVDTMRATNLVGMAAPQIGKSWRIFVGEIRTTKFRKDLVPDELRIFVNPIILKHSKRLESGYEGCGSVAHAGLFGPVKRYDSVEVSALDAKGLPFTLKAKGMLARIIQHELDHLDGILFIDKVNTKKLLDRDIYLKTRK